MNEATPKAMNNKISPLLVRRVCFSTKPLIAMYDNFTEG